MDAPPVITSARQPAHVSWPIVLLALMGMAATVALFLFNPSQYGFYPRCELYVLTGIYCPGCGSLRALHQLTHGHLATALRCNPLLVLSLPVAAFFSVRWLMGKPLPNFLWRRQTLIALGVVVILFTILRNIHCAPFIYLAPP